MIFLEGPQLPDVARHTEAGFGSTAVRVKDCNRARVEDRLTLTGMTRPAAIDAELVDVGRWMEGAPTIGLTGTIAIDAADFTQLPMTQMVGNLTVFLNVEFVT